MEIITIIKLTNDGMDNNGWRWRQNKIYKVAQNKMKHFIFNPNMSVTNVTCQQYLYTLCLKKPGHFYVFN